MALPGPLEPYRLGDLSIHYEEHWVTVADRSATEWPGHCQVNASQAKAVPSKIPVVKPRLNTWPFTLLGVPLYPICQEELYDPGRDMSINPNENSILTS